MLDYKAKSLAVLDQAKLIQISTTRKIMVLRVFGFNNFYRRISLDGLLTSAPIMSATRSRQRFKPLMTLRKWTKETRCAKSMGLDNGPQLLLKLSMLISIYIQTTKIWRVDHDVDALEPGDAVLRDQLTQSINGHILSDIYRYVWMATPL